VSAPADLFPELVRAVVAALLAVAGLVGLLVAVHPPLLDRLRGPGDRRVSMRRATRALDVPRNADRWFYRHHRVYGTVVILLSVVLLTALAFGSAPAAWERALAPAWGAGAGIVADTARVVLWVLGLVTLVIGVVVLVRPSALKSVERWANRWITPRRALRGLEREHRAADRWLAAHPRLWGLAMALLCGAALLAL
jgi:hypothetical protein